MIRIDEIWLATQPMDMRAGMDTVMTQVLSKRPLNTPSEFIL